MAADHAMAVTHTHTGISLILHSIFDHLPSIEPIPRNTPSWSRSRCCTMNEFHSKINKIQQKPENKSGQAALQVLVRSGSVVTLMKPFSNGRRRSSSFLADPSPSSDLARASAAFSRQLVSKWRSSLVIVFQFSIFTFTSPSFSIAGLDSFSPLFSFPNFW